MASSVATTQPASGFHAFDSKSKSSGSAFSPLVIVWILMAILLGIFTGYGITMLHTPSVHVTATTTSGTAELKAGDVIGSNDTSTFKDSAEGELEVGGINNEGQYHLVRPGGDSQSVYLTSSSVDLSQFVKHKVKVWGATQAAKTAGWLMDVGRVEVLE